MAKDDLVERAVREARHDERKKIIAQGCIHTVKAAERTAPRPDLEAWQADQHEYFNKTILEIVGEYALWRDGQPDARITALEDALAEARGELEVAAHAMDEARQRMGYFVTGGVWVTNGACPRAGSQELDRAITRARAFARHRASATAQLEAENTALQKGLADAVRTNTENARLRGFFRHHLCRAKDMLFAVAENAADEGDRAYFGSTNEPARMLDFANELEAALTPTQQEKRNGEG